MKRKYSLVFVIATLLLSIIMVNVPPSYASQGSFMAAPEVNGLEANLTPGQTFYINITVWNVTGMLGYAFRLSYDTNVLTATSFRSYAPFTQEWPSSIHETEGYVDMAYCWPIPEFFGTDVFPEDPPLPVARIDFAVDSYGFSSFDLSAVNPQGRPYATIVDVFGGSEEPTVVNGSFYNVVPQARVSLEPRLIADPTLIPRETFNVTVGIAAVTNLWGYEILLAYNKSVLTATDFESHDPFTQPFPSMMDDSGIWKARPTRDGLYRNWTGNYQTWDDITADGDITYVSTTSTNKNQTSNLRSPVDMPAWNRIEKVKIIFVARQTTGDEKVLPILVIGGNVFAGSAVIPSTVYAEYSNEWTVNPATDSAWTWSEISALQAGVQSQQSGATWDGELRVTQMFVEVYHEAGLLDTTYTMPFGTVVGTSGSFPLLSVNFTVDSIGTSLLDIVSVKLTDPMGIAIGHDDIDGYFNNQPTQPPPPPPENLIPLSSGTAVTVYEMTDFVHSYSFLTSDLMVDGGAFSTTAKEEYTLTSDGTYLRIHCFRDAFYSGIGVGNNIIAVRLDGVAGFTEGTWATVIKDYLVGYHGTAESRYNALGSVDEVGPFGEYLWTLMGDQHSELILGFTVQQTPPPPPPPTISVEVKAGSVHFRGEIAEFYILVSSLGKPIDANVNAILYYSGTLYQNLTARAEHVSLGLYRIPYTIPLNASTGTYALVVEAHYLTASGISLESFLLSPTLTGWNAQLTSINGTVATIKTDLGVVKVDINNINAKLVEINGTVGTLETALGAVEVDVSDINAKLTAFDNTVATIQTDIGKITTDVANIQLRITSIDGTTATIQTTVGTFNGQITSIQGDVATINTDLGIVKANLPKGWTEAQQATATPLYIIIAIVLLLSIGTMLMFFRRRKP